MADEWLFYTGIVLTGISAAAFFCLLWMFKRKARRLSMQLDEEYGREEETGREA